MDQSRLHRREFHRLSAAALGGMLAGSVAGCGGSDPAADGPGADGSAAVDPAGKHLCRGLNDCKAQGLDEKNACRGAGACATFAHHDCGAAELHDCKGQTGCGQTPGKNDCKDVNGGCHVPLMDSAWETVRAEMEAKWKQEGKEFHEAPAKPM
jgi:hypothetical protein